MNAVPLLVEKKVKISTDLAERMTAELNTHPALYRNHQNQLSEGELVRQAIELFLSKTSVSSNGINSTPAPTPCFRDMCSRPAVEGSEWCLPHHDEEMAALEFRETHKEEYENYKNAARELRQTLIDGGHAEWLGWDVPTAATDTTDQPPEQQEAA